MRIYKTHGAEAVQLISENPYRFALPPPPAIASGGTQEPMVRRLFPGGNEIRTLGPRQKGYASSVRLSEVSLSWKVSAL